MEAEIPNRPAKSKKHALPLVANEVPERFSHWARKAEAGSRMAAIALKCLECSNWQQAEVANCGLAGCSLYHLRPYGRRKSR